MGALGRDSTFLFEGFHLDRHGLFRRDELWNLAPVAIGGRALDLLGVLVERHGEILSKEEIMAAVWPKAVVEDGNLTLQISALRRILDRGRSEGSCIQTVARRGYRFAAAVSRVEAEASEGGRPVEVEASGRPRRYRGPRAPRLSIVVLPFVNLSSDPEQEYFAYGITDDLTTDLSRIAGSFVIACSTAFTYKGKSVDVKQVGRELGVRYVLEGSVRRLGSRVRMNVQLLDAETGGHVWAERFDIDRRKSRGSRGRDHRLPCPDLEPRTRRECGPPDRAGKGHYPDAHDLAMRGWALFYRPWSAAILQGAQRAFERAFELDPQSVEARIGLATVLAASIIEGWSAALPDDQAQVEELLGEVFARGSNDAMAHLATAMLRRSQHRLIDARIEAERAVALDHNNSAALYELGLTYMFLGQPETGIAHIEKAIRLSPRDPRVSAMQYGLGRCHLLLGHLDQAIELFDRVRAATPRLWDVRLWLAGALGLRGDLDGARAELTEAQGLKPEIGSLTQWAAHQSWIVNPEYRELSAKTLNVGLRQAGFPEG